MNDGLHERSELIVLAQERIEMGKLVRGISEPLCSVHMHSLAINRHRFRQHIVRDILKVGAIRRTLFWLLWLTIHQSESCGLSIPEIELVLQAGTLGGRFTTLEGILDPVYEELSEKVFASGDAADDHHAFENFLKKLKAVCPLRRPEGRTY